MSHPPSPPASRVPVSGSRAWFRRVWVRLLEFGGVAPGTSHLWPRWLVLRAVGVVFVVVFSGVIKEAPALIGPDGVAPLPGFLEHVRATHGSLGAAVLRCPSLFWIDSGPAMLAGLGWLGLAAAVALVCNLWPRLALFLCWLVLLSFVSVYHVFSPTQMDGLMIETALLCIPYAPRGLRPGLGVHSPPSPLLLFMVRWLLFRVMFEDGLVKLFSGEPRWRNFTAMEVMYETAPFPTILGFLDHQLSHTYHLFEIGLTFLAELLAPLLAVFAGRRGRWIALGLWWALQGGIQATANFGWLNTAAAGLGLLLLDDQMIAQAAERLRLRRFATWLAGRPGASVTPLSRPVWRTRLLHAGLWTHFGLTWYVFALGLSRPVADFSYDTARPLRYAFLDFKCANSYTLYETFLQQRLTVEFAGSNDAGRTWRPYRYHHLPQDEHRVAGFVAPRFLRFEATLQIVGSTGQEQPLIPLVASHLLAGNARVTGLFAENPFPDRPPTLVRMRLYRLRFTDLATWRRTGAFWKREDVGDYAPMLYVGPSGRVERAVTVLDVERAKAEAGNPESQAHLGFMFATGRGASKQPTEARRWFRRAAEQGVAEAQYNLGVLMAEGTGGSVEAAEAVSWFRRTAEQGHGAAQFELGVCLATGEGTRQDEVEAFAWFELAAEAGHAQARSHVDTLRLRLGPAGIAAAHEQRRRIQAVLDAHPRRP